MNDDLTVYQPDIINDDNELVNDIITEKNKSKTVKNDVSLRTFSIHETNPTLASHYSNIIIQYKHLENTLNILIKDVYFNDKDNTSIFYSLLNKILMKAVLSSNSGGDKTKVAIASIHDYYNPSLNPRITTDLVALFQSAIAVGNSINDKNVSQIVSRLRKDWLNFFKAKSSTNAKAKHPKAKKLAKVYSYSVPLETSKFSLAKEHLGLLGINLQKEMEYVQYYSISKKQQKQIDDSKQAKKSNEKFLKYNHSGPLQKVVVMTDFKPKYLNKKIQSVNVSLSHGNVYYNLTYVVDKPTEVENLEKNLNIHDKQAGIDVGLENLFSILVNDDTTESIIISGKQLISVNCYFNKKIAHLSEEIDNRVIRYDEKTILAYCKEAKKKVKKVILIPAEYDERGKHLIRFRSQMFEQRKRFMDDYAKKLSKKIIQYLLHHSVNKISLSKNLSFTKTTGEIEMRNKTKQKFYQIPFGKILNMIEERALAQGMEVVDINEAYTSKTSALTRDVNEIVKLAQAKKEANKASEKKSYLGSKDFNGSRGSKKAGKLNNPLGRGMFKDKELVKVVNADLNAAGNHIKVAFKEVILSKELWKYCNPIKFKSNHEFDLYIKRKFLRKI